MSAYIGNEAVRIPRLQNIGIDNFYINTFVMVYTCSTF